VCVCVCVCVCVRRNAFWCRRCYHIFHLQNTLWEWNEIGNFGDK